MTKYRRQPDLSYFMKANIRLLIALFAFSTLPLSFINPEYTDLAARLSPPALAFLLKDENKRDKDK
jgi:hypothetical protein